MLTWPHPETGWRDQLETVYALWTRLATAIARFEPVLSVCRDEAHLDLIRAWVGDAGAQPSRLRFALAPSDDSWARDHGPIAVLEDGAPTLVDFDFNAWGQKYPFARDDAIVRTLHCAGAFGERPLVPGGLVLEGGAIDTDGAGTLLAVERTLVDPLRNPGRDRGAIESVLAERLGIRHFLWLRHGQLAGDDTDGHIDTLARFCDPRTICYLRGENADDPDYPGLSAMETELQALRDPQGRPYRLVPLPCPAPVLETRGPNRGARLPAGYANFLILDGAVLMPVYDDPADALALEILAGLFPGREVLPLDCRPLIRRGGSLHCVTMQLPAGVLAPDGDAC
jgi:agmatine/peptidylarginine deiminase